MTSVQNTEQRFTIPGLNGQVEILVDRWGVPHIYASSTDDAFFAQGFNAARDRLWQIDLWRRRGLGLLSEAFGPSFVEKDRASRLFLYRGAMRREWLAYSSDTKRVATAFVAGINAYVKLTEEKPQLLPEEFKIAGYRPAYWEPEDVARVRSHGLYKNLTSEVQRVRVLREFGTLADSLRSTLEPAHEVVIPDGLDLTIIPDDVLRVYELATTPPVVTAEMMSRPAPREKAPEGSNNWVIDPKHTATGRPILANDPHRALSVPSLRYVAHLSAPGMDVIGAGEPALPGVSIGHNGTIALGLTIFSMDQEDLYFYETNPENRNEYRYKGRWEPMEIEHQSIPIRDQAPQEVELKFTRHGPVIYEIPEQNLAFAARVAWLEEGMAPYLGSMDYMRAKDWDSFLAAMNRWGSPGENQVYADVEGNIGWKPGGLVPRRPNWDGLLPVPGDGRYEWDGFLDGDELPVEFNPDRGWIATANEMNLPEDFPAEETKIGFEWYPPYRLERLTEVLNSSDKHSLEGSVRLQSDFVSVPARRIVKTLDGLHSDDPKIQRALDLLRGWDGNLATDSAAAALFEVWYRSHLRPQFFRRVLAQDVPSEKLDAAVAAATPIEDLVADARPALRLLENPDERLGSRPEAARAEVLLTSLGQAVDHVEELLGNDWDSWEWGRLHNVSFQHPFSALIDESERGRFNVGPAPRGGSGDTVGNTAYRADYRQIGGSTFRIVIDVGSWDNSLFMNSPGQSGRPGDPHYADLFDNWASNKALPLLYSREAIEKAVDQRIVLEPQG